MSHQGGSTPGSKANGSGSGAAAELLWGAGKGGAGLDDVVARTDAYDEKKNMYIRQMVLQFLTCKDSEVRKVIGVDIRNMQGCSFVIVGRCASLSRVSTPIQSS